MHEKCVEGGAVNATKRGHLSCLPFASKKYFTTRSLQSLLKSVKRIESSYVMPSKSVKIAFPKMSSGILFHVSLQNVKLFSLYYSSLETFLLMCFHSTATLKAKLMFSSQKLKCLTPYVIPINEKQLQKKGNQRNHFSAFTLAL